MRVTRVDGALKNRHLVRSGADVSATVCATVVAFYRVTVKHLSTSRWNAASSNLFRLPTTRILAWNICWLALLREPIGITSCKPTPRTYPHDAQLDYFRITDKPP